MRVQVDRMQGGCAMYSRRKNREIKGYLGLGLGLGIRRLRVRLIEGRREERELLEGLIQREEFGYFRTGCLREGSSRSDTVLDLASDTARIRIRAEQSRRRFGEMRSRLWVGRKGRHGGEEFLR